MPTVVTSFRAVLLLRHHPLLSPIPSSTMQHLLAKQRGFLLERLHGSQQQQQPRRSWCCAALASGAGGPPTTTTTPTPPQPRHNELITSPTNRFVRHCVRLRDSPRHRWEHGATLLVGATLLTELAEATVAAGGGRGGGGANQSNTPLLAARVLFLPDKSEEEGQADNADTQSSNRLATLFASNPSTPVVRASRAVLRCLAGVPTAGEGAAGEERLAAAVVDLPRVLVAYVKGGLRAEEAAAQASRVLVPRGDRIIGGKEKKKSGGSKATATTPTTPTTPKTPLRLLALESVQDPGNLGTLLRTAAAFGWTGAWLLPGCADPFGAKAVRAARGAQLRAVPLVTGPGAGWDALTAFADAHGARLVAAALPGQVEEKKGRRSGDEGDADSDDNSTTPTILVLGSEGQGLSDEALKRCHASVAVPMVDGAMESLNVAVAGGVLMFAMSGGGEGGGGASGGARRGKAAAAAPSPPLVDRLLRDLDAL